MFKIPVPNHTQTPNDLFDHWLPLLKEGELKVLLVIMRKTFGYHKPSDCISLSQLQHYTGLSETTVLSSIKSLTQMGLVRKETVGAIGKQETHYQLIVVEDSNNSYPPKLSGGDDSNNPYPPKLSGGTPPNCGDPPPQIIGDTKETSKEKEKQQQAAAPTAAALVKNSDQANSKSLPICESLNAVDIPERDKIEITKMYPVEAIEHAIKWVITTEKPIQCLAAAIKWACKTLPSLKNVPTDSSIANKSYAQKYENLIKNGYLISVSNEIIEITHPNSQTPFSLKFTDNGFVDQLNSGLRKRGFDVIT